MSVGLYRAPAVAKEQVETHTRTSGNSHKNKWKLTQEQVETHTFKNDIIHQLYFGIKIIGIPKANV